MAFRNKDLSVLAYANGFTLWHYASDDNLEDIVKEGYFDPVYTIAGIGDIIIINAIDTTQIMFMRSLKPHIILEEMGKRDESI